MAYKILVEECAFCDLCVGECPVEAISKVGGIYVIDAERCDDCFREERPACLDVCPVVQGCIVPA